MMLLGRRLVRPSLKHALSLHTKQPFPSGLPSHPWKVSLLLGVKPVIPASSLRFYTMATSHSSIDTSSTTAPPPKPTKEETPVEKAIRDAKEEQLKQQLKEAIPPTSAEPSSSIPPSQTTEQQPSTATDTILEPSEVPTKKLPLTTRIKNELIHYWHGSKLLGAEIGISSRLLLKLMRGHSLSRREQRQLKRTTGDLVRLVPFIIIVIIPFLELLLPVLLTLFPNMLPSTFESKYQAEEKKKKLLKVRLEVAHFLQETVSEMAVAGSSKTVSAKEFVDFFNKFRTTGDQAPTEEVIKIAKKFEDKLTLNSLSRPQLVSMCKYMNINAFGTDAFLRTQIVKRLKLIQAEGVDSLTVPELQHACQARGIRSMGASPARLRSELSQWMDLHLNQKIPSSLLLLSRAFVISERVPTDSQKAIQDSAQALQATLSSLPDQVVNEAALEVAEAEGVATYKQKLNVLQEQEELIADELEQEATQEAVKKAKLEEEEEKKAAAASTPTAEQPATEFSASTEDAIKDEDIQIPEEDLKQIADALKTLTTDSALTDVKEKLQVLKEDRKEFKEDIEELKQVTQHEPVKATNQLGDRVDKMLERIEKELVKYDSEIGSKLNILRPDEEGRLTIAELEEALKIIKKYPNDDRIKKIVKKLDADGDGIVALNEILVIAEEAERQKDEGHGVVVEKATEKKTEEKKTN